MKNLVGSMAPCRLFALLGAVLAASVCGSALAQSAATPAQSLLDSRVVASVGTYLEATVLDAGLDASFRSNPVVDFDKTFGKDDHKPRARVDLLWRITPAHRLTYVYFNADSTRTRAVAEDVHWGDVTYRAGAAVTAQTRLTVNRLAYEYAFLREPGFELAAIVGAYMTKFSAQLSGIGSIANGNGTTVQGQVSREASVNAPLPMLGLGASKTLGDNWLVEGQAKLLRLGVNDVRGTWSDIRVALTYMATRNLGLGVGYDRFNSDADVSKTAFNGHLGLGYSGAQVFLTAAF